MRYALAILVVVLATTAAMAADWVPASLSDGLYEGFDGMGETDTAVPMFQDGFFEETHWRVTQDGADMSTSLAKPGTVPANGGYNMGTTMEVHGYNDRALGAFAGDSSSRTVQVKLVNDTAEELAELFVQFDIERWIAADTGKTGKARLVLEQASVETTLVDFVSIAGVQQPYWNDATLGEFGYGWVDGNAEQNARRGLGGLIDLAGVGVSVAAGEEFTLRWDLAEVGNTDTKSTGLAVDNILVAVPEPTVLAVLAVGGAGLLSRRRRN
jgi:hypothetical protein